MTGEPFTKILRIGTVQDERDKPLHVFVKIEHRITTRPTADGDEDQQTRLSFSGVEGPMTSGNAWGLCGQIVMGYRTKQQRRELTPAPGWTDELVDRLFDEWDRWHLNDCTAGSPAQEEELRRHNFERERVNAEDHFTWAKRVLERNGLQPDPNHDNYSYGSAWLYEEVPADVLDWLRALPDTDRTPAWV